MIIWNFSQNFININNDYVKKVNYKSKMSKIFIKRKLWIFSLMLL